MKDDVILTDASESSPHERQVSGTPLFCEICAEAFFQPNLLKTHMLLHIGEKTYLCPHCPEAFSDPLDARRHVQVHTGNRPNIHTLSGKKCFDVAVQQVSRTPLFCEICAEEFFQTSLLKAHMLLHIGEKTYLCPHCPKTFLDPQDARRHVQTHTVEKPYTSSHSEKKLSDMEIQHAKEMKCEPSEHGKTQPGMQIIEKKSSSKEICSAMSTKTSGLRANTQQPQTNKKCHNCPLCSKVFSFSSNVKRHLRSHTAEKPYVCSHCGKQFGDIGNLRKHERIHITDSKREHKCVECRKIFSCRSSLIRHMESCIVGASEAKCRGISKTAKSAVSCELCTRRFLSPSALRTHMQSHTGTNPNFYCRRCSEAFLRSNDLKRHMQLHIGPRTHMCLLCPKTFAKSHDLKRHIRIHTGEKPHTCTQCGRPFSDMSNLRKHELRHIRGKKTKSTKQVTESFRSLSRQSTNMQAEKGAEQMASLSNVGEFTVQEKHAEISPINLKKIATASERMAKASLRCEIRAFTFASTNPIRMHMQSHSGEKPISCSHCPKAFLKASDLKRHMQLHMGANQHMCHLCPKAFARSHDLKRHIRIHTGERPHTCTQCGRPFSDMSNLRKHELRHARGRKSKSTKQVTEFFKSLSRQSTKMQAEKAAEQMAPLSNVREFTVQEKHAEITASGRISKASLCCEICALTFASTSAMRMHMRSHSDEKPNICLHCPKTFLKANDLKRHVQLHMGAKPYMCLLCPKAFARSHDLKRHIRIHTGERPHKCTQCGRPFSDASNLRKHELRHARGKESKSTKKVTDFFKSVSGQSTKRSPLCNVREFTSQEKYAKISSINFEEMATVRRPGFSKTAVHCESGGERPYVCSHCPKAFLKAYDLKMHIQTHIGAKPHKCPQCPKAFLKAHDLKRHIRIHTGEKPHTCTQCGRAFSDMSNLKKHEMRHERDRKKKTNQSTKHANLQGVEGATFSPAILTIE